MDKKSVFLLQDTKESVDELLKLFSTSEKFEVVGFDLDAINALSAIGEIKPDFLITEMVLKGYDGLSVISKIKEMKIKTRCVVLSAVCSQNVIEMAMESGASYFMAKPFDFTVLENGLNKLSEGAEETEASNKMRKTSLDEKISKIFINVGIPPHIKGYSFLREGVKMAVENPSIINSITKGLYPKIGEKYCTTASKVERAIRHAIEVAWNRGRIESINSILGVRAYVGAEKPTNGEFIALIADKMLLEEV